MNCWGVNTCTGPWYGGNWYWNTTSDQDIYAHVFDQNGPRSGNGTPYRYTAAKASPNDNSWLANLPSNAICSSDSSTTSGNTLYSRTHIRDQKSCNPNTLNAGNWYNFPAATAGSKTDSGVSYHYDTKNSICPKGWQLPPSSNNKSYNTLITTYGTAPASSDSALLANSAMSFVRLGWYYHQYGALEDRGHYGTYWSSTAYSSTNSLSLTFNSGGVGPQYGAHRAIGYPIRCVSR